MEQLEFFDIPSPCIGVCQVNNKGYCKGCLRSREERLYWQRMTDVQKRQVMHMLQQRRQKIKRRGDTAVLEENETFAHQERLDF
ncbi:DUF1289 domain-containing protein [Neisseria weaveri]|uniref:Predicted Fe-S protein n=1 Tax=Neisseria weaveri TaxID=28091 RepID=A0A3S4YSH8_9NEIS|nr:DUF1289 domain-containing protein [Neisseria weaveri]EGV36499.1 putative oxidoreductase [Neisseria weaveri ATCC 51223]SAY50269.1 Predicted Fe-S protein [Neisseria weaveri]VEJ51674.1 Predicted Fe-S protein [Neisseria weaveri]